MVFKEYKKKLTSVRVNKELISDINNVLKKEEIVIKEKLDKLVQQRIKEVITKYNVNKDTAEKIARSDIDSLLPRSKVIISSKNESSSP